MRARSATSLGRRIAAALALLVACVLAPAARAVEIEVRVVHRSGDEVGELDVQLLGIKPEGETLARQGRTGAHGRMRFAELPVPAAYLVMAQYRGVSFHGEGVRFADGEDLESQSVEIEVHEPSRDPAPIGLDSVRLFVEQEAGAYRFDQIVELHNAGPSVIALDPEAPAPIRIALAPGHGELRTRTGTVPFGFELVDGFLELVGPVFPGPRELIFSYDVPTDGANLEVELLFSDRTPTFELYVRDELVAIEAGDLHPARPSRDPQGNSYQRFVGFDLAPQTRVPVRVRPLTPQTDRPYATAAVAALLGAGLLLFVGWPVTREAGSAAEPEESSATGEKEALYAALRDLEHDFETGKLSEADRERLRAELRSDTLAALARAPSEPGDGGAGRQDEPGTGSCVKCGHARGEGDVFCSRCGARL